MKKQKIKISRRDRMLVEKIIIPDCFASLAMTNKKKKKSVPVLPTFSLYVRKTRYFYSVIYIYNFFITNDSGVY
ncbi:MAG: hypothetical protein LBF04_02310 [Prevotellaceae bacterium]|jgi:hypothetical protein|nr:hypothetical protein [Prevotellaceae bacterium]